MAEKIKIIVSVAYCQVFSEGLLQRMPQGFKARAQHMNLCGIAGSRGKGMLFMGIHREVK